MKKKNLLKQMLIAVLVFSTIACFAQSNGLVKHNQMQKGQKGTVAKKINGAEVSPNSGGANYTGDKTMWDIIFSYNVAKTGEAGVETDGSNIFTAKWSSNSIYRYDMSGNFLDSFSIAGVTGLRDLAYDGSYFYGGANAAVIYKMDFTSHTLVSSINCPAGTTVRNIAYDPVRNGLWVGGWATDITCISPTGTVLATVPAANHALTGMYGSAYDGWSAGGPYLWVLDQGASGSGCYFNQINLTTMQPTGIVHNCTDISSTAMAGGAFCYDNGGVITLGGVAQGEKIFAYDITLSLIDGGVTAINGLSSSCSPLSASEDVDVTISNLGISAISNFQVAYTVNNGTPVVANISQTLNAGQTMNYTFTGAQALDLSVAGTYTIKSYTIITGDASTSNDATTIVVSVGAAAVPYSMGFENNEDLSGWYVQDVNQDGYTWGLYADNTLSHGGDNFAAYSYNSASDADDWLISTCIQLDASKTYNVSFWYRIQDDTYPEKMKLFIGTDTSVSSMTTQIEDYGTLSNMTYVQSVNIVNVPSTGTYHFGWYCYSDADMWDLLIDDILIEEQVGINEFSNTILSVYPNPAKDMLNISASENITNMKLVNVFGQVVLAKEVNGKISSVNTSNIADGIYYLQIETKNGLTTKSVAINK